MTALSEMELYMENFGEEPPLQKERTWGVSYRSRTHGHEYEPITPKHSPINVPFQLCRTFEKSRRSHQTRPYYRIKQRVVAETLLDRSALPQDKYMELLSEPSRRLELTRKDRLRKRKKRCCKCELLPLCRPRLIQMAVPNKRYVLANWKQFQHTLPAEMLQRFDQILKSGDNLEPEIARCYFKHLQKQKRTKLKKKKQAKSRKHLQKARVNQKWIDSQIKETVETIVEYIKHEPLFMLNYQQMMTSNQLLRYLTRNKVVKIKSRTTKNPYKKTVIEISDKVIKWTDHINFLADIQPIDSKELVKDYQFKLPPEEEEEEGLEEELGWEEEEEGFEGMLEEMEYGSDEGGGKLKAQGSEELGEDEEFLAQKILDKIKFFEDMEGEEGSLFDLLKHFDDDILGKLIKILGSSPLEFLEQEIDPEGLPGITYGDVLVKLRDIHENNLLAKQKEKPTLFLEEQMVEWAKNNDPEQIDDKVLDTIHETSRILADWFKTGQGDFGGGAPVDEIFNKDKQDNKLEATKPLVDLKEEDEDIEEDEEEESEFGVGGEDDELEEESGEEGYGRPGGQKHKPGTGGEDSDIDEDEAGRGRYGEDEGLEDYSEGEEGIYGEGGKYGEGEGGKYGEGEEGGIGEGGEAGIHGGEGEDYIEGLEGEGEGEFGEGEFGKGEFGEGLGPDGKPLGMGDDKIKESLDKLDSLLDIIRGHKPPQVFEHEPGTICCLSLKTWAVWLLQIATNAHKWTKWIEGIIRQVRHYTAIIRGDVLTPTGEKKVLYKEEWRQFVKDTEEKVIAWRQYSKHVKDLSAEIMENFHGKKVNCCPKCLQDHLIKNVVTAHETLQALTEAINCAGYWQRCLDKIVEQTSKFTDVDVVEGKPSVTSADSAESSFSVIEIEELAQMPAGSSRRPPFITPSEASYESVYEIEEIHQSGRESYPDFEILEIQKPPPSPTNYYEIEELEVKSAPQKEASVTINAPKKLAKQKKKKGKK